MCRGWESLASDSPASDSSAGLYAGRFIGRRFEDCVVVGAFLGESAFRVNRMYCGCQMYVLGFNKCYSLEMLSMYVIM